MTGYLNLAQLLIVLCLSVASMVPSPLARSNEQRYDLLNQIDCTNPSAPADYQLLAFAGQDASQTPSKWLDTPYTASGSLHLESAKTYAVKLTVSEKTLKLSTPGKLVLTINVSTGGRWPTKGSATLWTSELGQVRGTYACDIYTNMRYSGTPSNEPSQPAYPGCSESDYTTCPPVGYDCTQPGGTCPE